MKRIVYYVITATTEENERGIFHYSLPIKTLSGARITAKKARRYFPKGEGHVAIEKHHEVYERYSWNIDHEAGGSKMISYV